jgi:hypothetical protein
LLSEVSLSVAVLAIGAQPEDLVRMADQREVEFLCHGLLSLFDSVVDELDYLAALDAN